MAEAAADDLMRVVRHEMRTSINHVIGYSELLADQVAETELAGDLRHIQLAGNELLGLVNTALESSSFAADYPRVQQLGHAFRTPLNAIIGYAELLQEAPREALPATFAADLHRITTAGEKLLGLVSALLDVIGAEPAGDGIMVFFNDPIPIPDPALRAVTMAIAMRDRMATVTASWRTRGHDLGFGVGIALGEATLGRIGFDRRFDYAAIGRVTNLAARLCGVASAGQILVSQAVRAAMTEGMRAEPVAELNLKGFAQPVAAFNVQDQLTTRPG